MKLVIWTQYQENYGAHEGSGEGDCPQYGKNKGGEVVVVENLTSAQVAKILAQGIPTLTNLIEQSTYYSRETLVDYVLVKDDITPWSEWESPVYLRYENGAWRSRQVRDGADSGFHQSVKKVIYEYTLQPKGEQQGRTALYVTDKGPLTYAEWEAAYASKEAV